MKLSIFYIALILVFLKSCIEPFEPELNNYDDVLIIDGIVTNQDEDYSIKITRSYAYDENSDEKLSGAVVKVLDDSGNEYGFYEKEPGVYIKTNSDFIGIPGRKYKVWIQSGGEIYESEPQLMHQPVPIDSVYYAPDTRVSGDDDGKTDGIEVFVDVLHPADDVKYYAWEYDETWQFTAPYVSANRPGVSLCYKTARSGSFILGNTVSFQNRMLKNHPVYFISDNSNRLIRRYSTLLKQYTLSEESYLFLSNLQKNNETTGSLFDPTPLMIQGNISCSSNPDVPVMGFFQVSAVSTKRLFVDRDDLPKNFYFPTGFESCTVEEVSVNDYIEIRRQNSSGKIKMDTIFDPMRGTFIRYVNFEACFDCSLTGTKLKPEFWIDK